ncbi:hypothetical protein FRB90_002095 [Tulasnella sp. 427]|nr:hypothetical protein FRB90_002095 [Tulasnella sp. 427]
MDPQQAQKSAKRDKTSSNFNNADGFVRRTGSMLNSGPRPEASASRKRKTRSSSAPVDSMSDELPDLDGVTSTQLDLAEREAREKCQALQEKQVTVQGEMNAARRAKKAKVVAGTEAFDQGPEASGGPVKVVELTDGVELPRQAQTRSQSNELTSNELTSKEGGGTTVEDVRIWMGESAMVLEIMARTIDEHVEATPADLQKLVRAACGRSEARQRLGTFVTDDVVLRKRVFFLAGALLSALPERVPEGILPMVQKMHNLEKIVRTVWGSGFNELLKLVSVHPMDANTSEKLVTEVLEIETMRARVRNEIRSITRAMESRDKRRAQAVYTPMADQSGIARPKIGAAHRLWANRTGLLLDSVQKLMEELKSLMTRDLPADMGLQEHWALEVYLCAGQTAQAMQVVTTDSRRPRNPTDSEEECSSPIRSDLSELRTIAEEIAGVAGDCWAGRRQVGDLLEWRASRARGRGLLTRARVQLVSMAAAEPGFELERHLSREDLRRCKEVAKVHTKPYMLHYNGEDKLKASSANCCQGCKFNVWRSRIRTKLHGLVRTVEFGQLLYNSTLHASPWSETGVNLMEHAVIVKGLAGTLAEAAESIAGCARDADVAGFDDGQLADHMVIRNGTLAMLALTTMPELKGPEWIDDLGFLENNSLELRRYLEWSFTIIAVGLSIKKLSWRLLEMIGEPA